MDEYVSDCCGWSIYDVDSGKRDPQTACEKCFEFCMPITKEEYKANLKDEERQLKG